MTLRPGVLREEAVRRLSDCLTALEATRADINTLASQGNVEQARDRYLTWTEEAERLLRGLSVHETWTQDLFTARYSNIRDLRADSPRPWPLLDGEAAYQFDRLTQLRTPLTTTDTDDPDSTTRLVLDTNVWLHFETFGSDWTTLVSDKTVRLVVPLVVLRELDAHKNRGGSVAARRAKGVTDRLLRLTGDQPSPADALQSGVTLTLHHDPPDHDPRPHNDIELLDAVERISRASAGPVLLVSDDGGVHVAARARNISVLRPPDDWRLPNTDETTRENEKLKQDLAARTATAPHVQVIFRHNGQTHATPKPFTAPAPTADAEVAAAQQELPLKAASPIAWSLDVLEVSNEDRKAWYADVGKWATARDRQRYLKAAGHDLRLAATNTGGTAASDVEIILRAPDGYTFLTQEDLTSPQRPAKPERVFLPRFDPTDFIQSTWDVQESTASTHLDVIRQGGNHRPIDEPLWLVKTDGQPILEGVAITWTATGVTPPMQASGTLHIKPRPAAQ